MRGEHYSSVWYNTNTRFLKHRSPSFELTVITGKNASQLFVLLHVKADARVEAANRKMEQSTEDFARKEK